MPGQYPIFVFVVVVIGIVLVASHPGWRTAWRGVTAWFGSPRGWLPRIAPFTWSRFWGGVVAVTFAFVVLNALPHFLTRHEPQHCGLQVAGFPLTFRAFGGYAGLVSFHAPTLVMDSLLGLVVAAAMGYSVARLRWRRIQ